MSTAIIDLGLLTLALMIAFGGRGGNRFLALIPAATMAAIMFYVIAGGILMLATWLAAALAALVIPARRAARFGVCATR